MGVMAETECIESNISGISYAEFSCLYPTLGKTYFSWEKGFDPTPTLRWMKERPFLPLIIVICYGIFCVGGQSMMKSREAFNWRKILGYWNLGLCIFSLVGTFRTAPHLYHNMTTMSFRDNLCLDPEESWGSGSTGFWVQRFILSKIPELLDTFFIVVHKKPIIFLHWYHHVTVLCFCWHSYAHEAPSGLFFVVMNYAVHGIMYGYYFLMAMKLKPKWLNAMFITTIQISQMVIGVLLTLFGFYYYKTSEGCNIQRENNIAAFIMYGSYLFLFAQFFVRRYFKTRVKSKGMKKIE